MEYKRLPMLLLSLTALLAVASGLDADCKAEWDAQKLCYMNLFAQAAGVEDASKMGQVKQVLKQCTKHGKPFVVTSGLKNRSHIWEILSNLNRAGCKNVKALYGGGGGGGGNHGRVRRHGHGSPQHSEEMRECVKDKLAGTTEKQVVKQCMQDRLGGPDTYIPKHMLGSYHNRKGSKCPYRKMIKFLASAPRMQDKLNKMCGDDETKVDAFVGCIRDEINIDITNIDRDQIRGQICEQKDSCMTEKLSTCRDQMSEMFMASCDCKKERIEPKRSECATELGVETGNPHAAMTCDQLRQKIHQEYDMCADGFEWPTGGRQRLSFDDFMKFLL